MPRYKLTLEYIGTNYSGWQKNSPYKSLQQSLEQALEKYFCTSINTTVCGRTDAGVHALGQVVHFDYNGKERSNHSIVQGLNFHLLNEQLRVINASKVEDNFNARLSAKQRIYHYKITNRKATLCLNKERSWHVPQKLDLEKMKQASLFLLGKHDFTSFRDKQCQAKNAIRTLDEINFFNEDEENIIIEFKAKSFLHHMVRNITGTLYLAGIGKIKPNYIKTIIDAKNRTLAGITAPAHGLYFVRAIY